MNLFHLQCFQAVATENHITRASQKLNIAQPALSNIISKLEKELGVRLFDRIGRQIQLNACGAMLLSHVDVILAQWDDAQSKIVQYKRETETQVKLAVTGQLFPRQLIMGFKKEYPDIVIRQSMVMRDEIVPALLYKNDFVISSVLLEDEDIVAYPVKEERLYLLVSRNHRLASQEMVYLSDLDHEPLISLSEGYAFRDMIESLFDSVSLHLNIVYESFPSQFGELVEQEIGVAFIAESSIKNGHYPPSTCIVALEPRCQRVLYLLYEKKRAFSPAGKAFYRYVLNNRSAL